MGILSRRKEQAMDRAGFLGHDFLRQVWEVHLPGSSREWATMTCRQCGREIVAQLRPLKGGEPVDGSALMYQCDK